MRHLRYRFFVPMIMLALLFLLFAVPSFAATNSYSSSPGSAILDLQTTSDTINVPLNRTITGVRVTVDVSHTFIGDLTVTLTHDTTATSVLIYDRLCDTTDDMIITLADNAADPVGTNCATPYTGTYQPSNPLSAFNGESSGGDWTLSITDNAGSDEGTFNSWTLTIVTLDPTGSTSSEPVFLSIPDGRLNLNDLGAPAAIYCEARGVVVFVIDPGTSRGRQAFVASPAQVQAALNTARTNRVNTQIASGLGATLYALTSNELQVNMFYPRDPGVLYEFIFPATDCLAEFSFAAPPAAPVAPTPPLITGPTSVHIVQAGENLFRIGLRYGVPYQVLGALNGIAPPYTIFPGQRIIIPQR
jgi:subtilisin-like proprotein convertase family protein/LysM repeat protein